MVVMVVLLIGIMSVIRIFPLGFTVNRRAEMSTRGASLVNQEMERYIENAPHLMDAIAPVVPVFNQATQSYLFQIDTGVTPDDMGAASTTDYSVPWNYYFSDVNRIRRVLGERTRIPTPSRAANGNTGSYYVLSSGPFMDVSWDGLTRSLFVSSNPMYRRVRSVDARDRNGQPLPPYVPGWQDFCIDYGTGTNDAYIAFYPRTFDPANVPNPIKHRQFLITYSYFDNVGKVQTVVDQVLDVPDVPAALPNMPPVQPMWQPINPIGPIVRGSEAVSRKFVEIAPGAAFSDDAYEYSVVSPRTPAYNIGNPDSFLGANIGVLCFNPRGHDVTEWTSAGGSQPLMARIDYDVMDWHIIHDDRPLPVSAPYTLYLSLRGLKNNGVVAGNADLEGDQTIYQGIYFGVKTPAPQDNPDVMVVNTVTGDIVNRQDYDVNYTQGTVTLHNNIGDTHPSITYRVYYKAHGDWALQAQKACSAYRQRSDANLGFAEYYLAGTQMRFPLCDLGKTISIREFWYSTAGNTARHITSETYRLRTDPFTAYAYLDITSQHPDATGWDTTTTGLAARGVTGSSFKTRVIWNYGTTVNQTPGGNVISTRWQKIDLDSVLTRTP